MKYLFFLFLFPFFNPLHAQHPNNFAIRGKLKGLKNNSKIFLVKNTINGTDTLQHTLSINESFYFKGTVPVEAEFHIILLEDHVSKMGKPIFLDNSKIQITGSIEDWPRNIRVIGSKSHSEYEKFQGTDTIAARIFNEANVVYSKSIIERVNSIRDGNPDSILYISKAKMAEANIKKAYEDKNASWKAFIKNNPNSLYTPFLIRRFEMVIGVDTMNVYYSKLTKKAQQSYEGLLLKKDISVLLKSKVYNIGDYVQDFSAITPSGDSASLSRILKNSKLTLLDFWASWCVPCRNEFINTKKVYSRYNKQGFNIVAVSNDSKKEDWIKAIKKDSLTWYNLSDLGGNNGDIAKMFKIYKLPTNYLLDSEGKIIAIDIYEDELEKEIQKFLQ